MGWLSSYFDYDTLKSMKVIDIGSGTHILKNTCSSFFNEFYAYDVVNSQITKDELLSNVWDMIFLFDVLEHFGNIDEIFDIKWKYAYISFPETPLCHHNEELSKWKHYKPNEHIYCLNKNGMVDYMKDHACTVIASSNHEDMIRTRWNKNLPNISTILVKR
jgi:hypothetical protein